MKINNIKKIIVTNFRNALHSRSNLNDMLTDEKLEDKAINKVWKSPEERHVISGILPEVNLGYGGDRRNANLGYGIGPERLINSSNYALRSTFTFEGIKLTRGLGVGLSNEFSAFLEYISLDLSQDKKTVKFDGLQTEKDMADSIKNKGYAIIASGSIDLHSKGTYFEVMVSNVNKNLINYKGDVSIHLVRQFNVLSDFFYGGQLSEKRRELYNSMKTSDLYAPRGSATEEISNNFKWVVKRNIKFFSEMVRVYESAIEQISGKKPSVRTHNIITMYNV